MACESPGTTLLRPGAITTKYGVYRVAHSDAHHPLTETLIDRGIVLPECPQVGCYVTFELVKLVSCRDIAAADVLPKRSADNAAHTPATEKEAPKRPEQQTAALQSWKEIAEYMGRGVRTVQRWERDAGLPIRRPRIGDRGPVIAFPDELDKWLHSRSRRKLD